MKRLRLALLCLLILLGGSCTKNPSGPVFGLGPFVFAITDKYPDGYSRVFYISTVLDSVVDSLLLPYQIFGLGVSQNDQTLYLGIAGLPFNGLEIDTRTKATTYFGPNTGVPIPFEKFLINPWTSDFFDANTHRLVYKADSLTPTFPHVGGRRFDSNRKLFYGPGTDAGRIAIFDYRHFKIVKTFDLREMGLLVSGTAVAVVTYDGCKYYYSGVASQSGYFAGFDLRTGKPVAEYLVIGGIGYLGITPLTHDIYRTDAGYYIIFDPPPSGLVQIYSPIQEAFKTPIDITKEPNPCDSIVRLVMTDQIVMSADGRKAYLSMYDNFSVMVLDVRSNTIKKVLCGFGFVNSLVTQRN